MDHWFDLKRNNSKIIDVETLSEKGKLMKFRKYYSEHGFYTQRI